MRFLATACFAIACFAIGCNEPQRNEPPNLGKVRMIDNYRIEYAAAIQKYKDKHNSRKQAAVDMYEKGHYTWAQATKVINESYQRKQKQCFMHFDRRPNRDLQI